MPTATDMFCGAGGSSLGASMAGVSLKLGLNHWPLAIDTHQTNFTDADHDCADVSITDPRRYGRTDILLASPECTNQSGTKGVSRKHTEPDLFSDGDPAAERSRATMWDVVRFADHHEYEAVIVENVIEARSWRLFPAWWAAMEALGYSGKAVYLNSMFAGVGQVPQSRDRMYVVWWRTGRTPPNLDIRPPAWCFSCEAWVEAVQVWKRADRQWGKYRQQYDYRCVVCTEVAGVPVLPAAWAIDWSLDAPRIGDRKRPLAKATVERIRRGLERYAGHTHLQVLRSGRPRPIGVDEPLATVVANGSNHGLVVQVGGSTFARGDSTTRVRSAGEPFRTQTGTRAEALVMPFITELRGGGSSARGVDEPLATVCASGLHHALTVPCGGTWNDDAKPTDEPLPTMLTRDAYGVAVPPLVGQNMAHNVPRPADGDAAPTVATGANLYTVVPPLVMRNNTARGDAGQMSTPASEPFRTLTTKGHQSLVVPYNRTGDAKPAEDHPLGAVTTVDRFALVIPTDRGSHAASKRARSSDEPLATQTTRQDVGVVPDPVPDVDDCGFRMLQPHEIQRAMRMETHHTGDPYIILGNKRDQVAQLGNAVTPPAMQLLAERVVEHLEARS